MKPDDSNGHRPARTLPSRAGARHCASSGKSAAGSTGFTTTASIPAARGGIEVPDALWHYTETGRGEKYSDNPAEDLPKHPATLAEFDAWGGRFAQFVAAKGRVTPGTHRASGYKAPGHFAQDLQLLWRDRRMSVGRPREGSSPQLQQDAGLNRDATRSPMKDKGEKLRE